VITDKLLELLASPIQGLTTPVAATKQYYANPGNDFWKLIGAALKPAIRWAVVLNPRSNC
jgi:hypothetical protein